MATLNTTNLLEEEFKEGTQFVLNDEPFSFLIKLEGVHNVV